MQRGPRNAPARSRRDVLAGALALGLGTLVARRAGAEVQGSAESPCFLTARQLGGRHEAVLIDERGHDLAALGLPDRGHSFAIDAARGRAVAFGRQPGFFAQVLALPSCAPLGQLPLPADRHFFGHGVFAADGTRLYATENDFDAGKGVIGVYDARRGRAWQRVGEFDTAGIGPHEVVLMPDARTLCVANGGLLTHPDFGKTPLNLATMKPSLAYLDAQDGRLLEQVELAPELFQLSIRHLAVTPAGDVWFACQHEGPATQQPALLGRHRRGGVPELFAGTRPMLQGLRNYLGSLCIDVERGVVATSSPVGGNIAYFDLEDGHGLGSTPRTDGCGVAACGAGRFIISDGRGAIVTAGPGAPMVSLIEASAEVAWDNHLRRV